MISAFFWEGPENRLLRHTLFGRYELVISRPLLQELERVLEEKFKVPDSNRRGLIDTLEAAAILVKPKFKIEFIVDDPDDDRVLECALAGNADTIITGDNHLLRIKEFHGIEITQANVFLANFPPEDH